MHIAAAFGNHTATPISHAATSTAILDVFVERVDGGTREKLVVLGTWFPPHFELKDPGSATIVAPNWPINSSQQ